VLVGKRGDIAAVAGKLSVLSNSEHIIRQGAGNIWRELTFRLWAHSVRPELSLVLYGSAAGAGRRR
jgi:hypothetical protein